MDLHQRLAEFFKRLEAAPPAANAHEALDLVCRLIEEVEDELCSIPHDGSIVADARHHRIYCRVDGGISIFYVSINLESPLFHKAGKHELSS